MWRKASKVTRLVPVTNSECSWSAMHDSTTPSALWVILPSADIQAGRGTQTACKNLPFIMKTKRTLENLFEQG